MSNNEIQVSVEGTDYFIRKFGGEKSFIIGNKLRKVATGVLSTISSEDTENNVDIVSALGVLDTVLDSEQQLKLFKDLTSSVYKGTSLIDFDKEFGGDMVKLIKLAIEVVQFNYKDVFQTLGFSIRD
jgi:hypothetical protein